ncbi:FBD-associated F-box protein At5g56370-like [Vicia villosa]|uniref:FBD-associated F-box protein At5g56370-like n=1 Tax=Vicia villosa TaxID=3911 RepID=UPI00273A9BD7|nr:FBD-associated F-box protein At5g56370-like [Vicia villosa]
MDRISDLPDDLICHILTFLFTKDVFRTSVLSKRWIDVWRSVPALRVVEGEIGDRETDFRITELVSSVLLSLHPIKCCKLYLWYSDLQVGRLAFPRFVKWINFVLQRKVEFIDLAFAIADATRAKLPRSILSCKTLVDLELHFFIIKDIFSISLPSLKTLCLDYMSFWNVQGFLLLLAGCPNLENIQVNEVTFLSQEVLTYEENLAYQEMCKSLTLSKLSKATLMNTFCHFPLNAFRNVKSLIIDLNKVYRVNGEIPTFHNLTKLKLSSINYNWKLLVQMLKKCRYLQHFHLSQGTSNEIIEDVEGNWEDPVFVPKCVSSHLKTCEFKFFSGKEGEFLMAKYILKEAKVLQSLNYEPCGPDLLSRCTSLGKFFTSNRQRRFLPMR